MRFVLALILLLGIEHSALAALLPPSFLDSVVAIGGIPATPPVPGQPPQTWQTNGTGFFYGRIWVDDVDPAKRQYSIFLVTAGHVIRSHMKQEAAKPKQEQHPLLGRLNPTESGVPGKEFPVEDSVWYFPHNNADIAIAPINFTYLESVGIKPIFFASDLLVANRDKMKTIGVSAGDGVFVLGFPMNLAGGQRNYVIVRQGCIARLSEMLDKVSPTFMLDTFVFPGNSGGPVVLKPEIASVQGTKSSNQALLIGMVLSYHPYTDLAISAQTGRPRIIFEENSGLAEVLPTDFINEAIDEFVSPKTIPYPM